MTLAKLEYFIYILGLKYKSDCAITNIEHQLKDKKFS